MPGKRRSPIRFSAALILTATSFTATGSNPRAASITPAPFISRASGWPGRGSGAEGSSRAPPTAEQVGLVGTHWSKGWIIEGNIISHSICSGIALGKYGDEFDNASRDTAEGYVKTSERALKHG